MKKIIILFFSIMLIGCFREANQNLEDLDKINIGMKYHQAKNIMRNNSEKTEDAFWDKNLFIDYYDSGPGASDYFKIIYNKKDSVVVSKEYGE